MRLEELKPVMVPIKNLERIWSPYRQPLWGPNPLRLGDVRKALQNRDFEKKEYNPDKALYNDKYRWPLERHAARVAFFVLNGWKNPIQIDVGVPEFQGWQPGDIVVDGNHRLAAAIYRHDKEILADISGSVSYANELLGTKL